MHLCDTTKKTTGINIKPFVYLSIAVFFLFSFVFYSSALVAQARAEELQRPSNDITYNLEEAYDLGNIIMHLAANIVMDDVAHGYHLSKISIGEEWAQVDVYKNGDVVVEFVGKLSTDKICNVNLPARLLPKHMTTRDYYINKLKVKGFDLHSSAITVNVESETITINFDGAYVKDLSFETPPT